MVHKYAFVSGNVAMNTCIGTCTEVSTIIYDNVGGQISSSLITVDGAKEAA